MSEVLWRRVNGEPFEYAIQRGQFGDEFVKLLDGSSLRRPLPWQPIETAPKDETPIDLWCRNISLGSTDAARFADMCWLDGNWEDWHGYILEAKWRPTHWMRPAAPPVEAKSEVGG